MKHSKVITIGKIKLSISTNNTAIAFIRNIIQKSLKLCHLMTQHDKREGGRIWNGPQKDDVINEQSLMGYLILELKNRVNCYANLL